MLKNIAKPQFKHMPKIGNLYFDIETAPVDNLKSLMPPFDPDKVKLGNVKDREKIAAKLQEAESNYESDFLANATLDARFCRVLVIGCLTKQWTILQGVEKDMLNAFWAVCEDVSAENQNIIGYYSHLFDLPILIQRSWFNNVPIPPFIREGRWWWKQSIDLHERFQCGNRDISTGGLNGLASFFGIPGKTDVDGAKFHEVWKSDREAAEKYLERDCDIVKQCAGRMGL